MNAVCQFFRNNYILANCEGAISNKAFTLNLSHFQMTEVPSVVGKCESLLKLLLNRNLLKAIPECVGSLVRLQVLTLDYNQLEEFPVCICQLTNLHFLNVSCNSIKHLPPEIGNLSMLETLWCNNTGLLDLPDELCTCEKLETLGLRGNKIKNLPKAIGDLRKLRWLTVDTNELTNVPMSMALLDKLVHLNLRANRLTSVPHVLMTMTKLQYVFLNDNCIVDLPDSAQLDQLKFLRMLNLSNNPISTAKELREMAVIQTYLYVNIYEDALECVTDRNSACLTINVGTTSAAINNIEANEQANVEVENEDHSSSDWANSVKTSELDTTDDSSVETSIEDLSIILPDLSRFILNL